MADINPDTIGQALGAGYSADEIVSHLAQSDDRFKQALAAGYKPDEILSHFQPQGMARVGEDVKTAANQFKGGIQDTLGAVGDVQSGLDAIAKQNPAVNQAKLAEMRSGWLGHLLPSSDTIKRWTGYTPYQANTPEAPYVAGAANMAGASVPGGPSGTLRRIAAGAVGGAASEAAGEATQGTALETPARIAGALVAPAAAERLALGARTPAATKITADQLKAAGDQGFDAFRNSGLELDPQAAQGYANATKSKLNGMGLTERNAGPVHEILDAAASPQPGSVWNASGIAAMKSELREAAADTKDFKPTPTAKAATTALDALDAHLNSLDPRYVKAGDLQGSLALLNDASSNWGAYKRTSALDRNNVAAELGAGATGSGMNLGNMERQQLKSQLLKKNIGFNDAERAAMENIVKGTWGSNLLRGASNVLGGGGGIGAMAVGGLAGAAGSGEGIGPEGYMLPIAGHLLRRAANRSVLNQIAKFQHQVATRSALGRGLTQPGPTRPMGLPGAALRTLNAIQQNRTPNAAMSP